MQTASKKTISLFFCVATTIAMAICRLLFFRWVGFAIGADEEAQAFFGCLIATVAFIALYIGRPYRAERYLETFPLKNDRVSWLSNPSACALLLIVPAAIGFGICFAVFGTDRRNLYLTLNAVIALPLFEETLFRGGLYKRLTDGGWNENAAIILLALFSALFQFQYWSELLSNLAKSGIVLQEDHSFVAFSLLLFARVILAFILALVCGVCRKKYDSILPPIALHVLLAIVFR